MLAEYQLWSRHYFKNWWNNRVRTTDDVHPFSSNSLKLVSDSCEKVKQFPIPFPIHKLELVGIFSSLSIEFRHLLLKFKLSEVCKEQDHQIYDLIKQFGVKTNKYSPIFSLPSLRAQVLLWGTFHQAYVKCQKAANSHKPHFYFGRFCNLFQKWCIINHISYLFFSFQFSLLHWTNPNSLLSYFC